MKKLLTGILALLTCFGAGMAIACGDDNGNGASSNLEGAKGWLDVLYGETNVEVYTDYTVENSTSYDLVTYNVEWSVSGTDKVTVERRENDTLINVDETITEEVEYVLTATIYDANGKSTTISFNRKVLVLVTDEISAPQENVAYNMYLDQLTLAQTLLLTGNMDESWYEMTTDNTKAANVYAEKVTEGYKFYVLGENDAKSYLTLEEYQKSNGYWGAHVSYSETGSVFYFDAAGCWASQLEHDTFFLGTYGSFDTASASASNYMKEENMGVSQYPLLLATPGSVQGGEIEGLPTVEEPAANSTLTIPEANALAEQLTQDTTTKGKFYVTGVISSIVKEEYGNLYIKDENDNALYVYGTYTPDGKVKYGDWADAPQVGDIVKLYGVLSNYNGPQMKSAWVIEINGEKVESGNSGGNTDDPVVTPPVDAESITAPVAETAYTMYIEQNGLSKTLYLTGNMDGNFFAMSENASQAADIYAEVVDGGYKFYFIGSDDAKSYITLTEYQKSNGYWGASVSFSADGTVFQYNAAGCWSTTLTNDTFFLGTYGTYNTASASASNYMKNFGTEQFPLLICADVNTGSGDNGDSGNTDDPVEPDLDDPVTDAVTATLSFADKANRTTFTTEQQVWEQNGVKLTNDKGASTTNVADYASPARFYKNSTITIECARMTKIVFECESPKYDDDYAAYLNTVLSTVSGATVTVDGTTVTIVFAEEVNELSVNLTAGQVRMKSLTVTYNK